MSKKKALCVGYIYSTMSQKKVEEAIHIFENLQIREQSSGENLLKVDPQQ